VSHITCSVTASFRASATFAFLGPVRSAIALAQVRRWDPSRFRQKIAFAASYKHLRVNMSPRDSIHCNPGRNVAATIRAFTSFSQSRNRRRAAILPMRTSDVATMEKIPIVTYKTTRSYVAAIAGRWLGNIAYALGLARSEGAVPQERHGRPSK
jgi:hypothetical protein